MKFKAGQYLRWRTLTGQLVTVRVVRPGRFRTLVDYYINEYWERPGDMGPPKHVNKYKWNYRMWEA